MGVASFQLGTQSDGIGRCCASLTLVSRQAGGASPAPTSARDTKIDVGGFAYGNATEYYLRDMVRPGST
jgi:hypothetical protein